MYLKIHFLKPVPICFQARFGSAESRSWNCWSKEKPRSPLFFCCASKYLSKKSRSSFCSTWRRIRSSSLSIQADRRFPSFTVKSETFQNYLLWLCGRGPPCSSDGSKKKQSFLEASVILASSRVIPLLIMFWAREGRLIVPAISCWIHSVANRWRVFNLWAGVRGGTLRSSARAATKRQAELKFGFYEKGLIVKHSHFHFSLCVCVSVGWFQCSEDGQTLFLYRREDREGGMKRDEDSVGAREEA